MAFCLNKPCYNDFFSTLLSPRGQVLFSTVLNFIEEHSDFTVLLLLKDYYHQWMDPTRVKTPVHNVDGLDKGRKLIQVHKVDGHN